jgi:TRAP-type C4-dicarboxylate transport system permease small subunit
VGLVISGAILKLLALGVSGVLIVSGIDLMHLLWPSSMMLTVGWHTTPTGITITALSVVLNCFLYLGIAMLLRFFLRLVLPRGVAK